jgi:hypothetical protein
MVMAASRWWSTLGDERTAMQRMLSNRFAPLLHHTLQQHRSPKGMRALALHQATRRRYHGFV